MMNKSAPMAVLAAAVLVAALVAAPAAADQCLWVISDTNQPTLVNLDAGTVVRQVAALPYTNAFTWSSELDEVNQITYGMGGENDRTLNAQTFAGDNLGGFELGPGPMGCPYALAANPADPLALMGVWADPSCPDSMGNSCIARVVANASSAAAAVQVVANFTLPGPPSQTCDSSVQFSTNRGFFDRAHSQYATLWTCYCADRPPSVYEVRVGWETFSLSVQAAPALSQATVLDYMVHPTTGISYVLVFDGNFGTNGTLVVSSLSNPDQPLIRVANSNVVFATLAPSSGGGVCLYNPGLVPGAGNGPFTPTFTCLDQDGSVEVSPVYGLADSSFRYADRGKFVQC